MSSLHNVLEQLQKRGERLTIQRRMVLEILCADNEHLTIQNILEHLEERGIHLTETTVYRILQWLKDVEAVSQTDLGQRGIVYQVVSERPHHHLVCLGCGAIFDIDDRLIAPLREDVSRNYGFHPRIDHMAIFGLCGGCQTPEETRPDE